MNTWSRGRTLGIGVGLIVLANAVALGGVWWNRSAIPESALTLSERELGLPWRTLRFAEDSGLSLNLNWRVSGREAGDFVSGYTFNGGTPEWLDATHMAALGFAPDDLASDRGRQRYTRQLPREVVLVMELGGPTWQQVLARAREDAGRHAAAAAANVGSKQFADRAKRASDELAQQYVGDKLFPHEPDRCQSWHPRVSRASDRICRFDRTFDRAALAFRSLSVGASRKPD